MGIQASQVGFNIFMPRPSSASRSSLALDNLRAVVILIVLAFHSVLAYVEWIPPHTSGFSDPPYGWRAFPIIDAHRWFGFDLFCAWQDVYLMALMFFLSGLFVWPSLQRKSGFGYARDRFLRLGVPYVFGIFVLLPIAFYPTYLTTAADPSVSDYLHRYWALPFVPNGQVWFLWQLLALNIVAAVINAIVPDAFRALGRWSGTAGQRPAFYFAVLVVVSVVAYVPLALIFTPWAWSESGVLSIQWCRPLLYAVYFFAGMGIGTAGIEVGLLTADGALARGWKVWFAVAIVSLLGWMGVTSLTLDGGAPIAIETAADLMFVIACAGGSFFLIAACLRFGARRSSALASLSHNAYSLYLVHYDYGIWLQYALLTSSMFALFKGAIVFGITLILSWLTVLMVQRIPLGSLLLAAPPRAPHPEVPSSGESYARIRQIDSQ
jgi:glucans biosynthesis protein C